MLLAVTLWQFVGVEGVRGGGSAFSAGCWGWVMGREAVRGLKMGTNSAPLVTAAWLRHTFFFFISS